FSQKLENMTHVSKIQQLLRQSETNVNESTSSFRALFSYVIHNHESFEEDDWKSLIQFDKAWESFGFEKAKEIWPILSAPKEERATENFINKSERKQVKAHQYMQSKTNSPNSTRQIPNGWKCHDCGFNSNYQWRFACYKC